MDWIQALILGIVQGLAEYLPISSSGHLEIFRHILGVELPSQEATMQFDIMVHAATVLSTIVVLHKMFYRLCKSFFTFRRDEDFWYVCKLLVSAIPVGIVGLCFKDTVEQFFGSGLLVVGICLCVTAALLTFAHLSDFSRATGRLLRAGSGRDITWWDAFIIGCGQAVAVLPGLSRSGTTIATGILLGDRRDQLAQFSFLMVIVPILGEALLDVRKMLAAPAGSAEVSGVCLGIGFLAAFIVGCAACAWMINLVKKGKMWWFAIYCAVVGIICILW